MSCEVRTMTRPELDLAIEWAAREGWNPGLRDADAFFAADPQGFFVALENGEPVGCFSAVAYPENFGFLGLYIVRPEYRGRGHGMRLWQAGIDYLGPRTIGLDGVVEQQANYARTGFRLAYRNIRFAGRGRDRVGGFSEDPRVAPSASVPFAALEAFDRRYFPSSRTAFLQAWSTMEGARSVVYLESGVIRGWSVIRPCRDGFKIGPLLAESAEIANALFESQRAFAGPDAAVFLDVPECNPGALALVERHGMDKVFETARMYKGPAPDVDLRGLYGVTTFELG